MREYIRMHAPGGQFFLTLVTHRRAAILCLHDHVQRLRCAMAETMKRHPFTIWGAVILPDHLHLLIELPPDDSDFSTRAALIKSRFKPTSETLDTRCSSKAQPSPRLESGSANRPTVSASQLRRRERDVWQRRFWEHTIRGPSDFEAHMDCVHYNPVKHGYAACPHAWPHSSFPKWVRAGRYPADWACSCVRPAPPPASIGGAELTAGE